MKKLIIRKIMKYIKNNTDYNDIKLKEIEYGLTGMYLTITKMIVISLITIVLGIFKEMLIFLILFNILRSVAFGMHATKSWICLITSIMIFIGFPLLSDTITINLYIKVITFSICCILIFKNSPADTKKRPIVNKKRRLIYKLLSTTFAIIYFISAIFIKNNFLSNCLLFALILENCLISPSIYRLFKLPYNNYISFLKEHPDFAK